MVIERMKQILYIEDSRSSQLIVQKFLGGFCETTAVSSVSDARTRFNERRFDLIITDFHMPEGTPLEFIREIRRCVSPMELPILLVSASLDPAMLNTALAVGVNDGLPKPLDGKTFLDTVKRLLSTPYLRPADVSFFSITSLEWTQDGRYYQLCPELQVTAEGANHHEANDSMTQLARERAAGGAPIKEVLNARLSSQIIRVIV
jgi:CheY-like chemotaxis protein